MHVAKYGAKDIEKYKIWFEAKSKDQQHVPLDIMPNMHASSIHHMEVKHITCNIDTSGVGTSREATMIEQEEVEEEGLGKGLQDMLEDFFGGILPSEE